MGPAFHLPATSQEGKGPPPYHADDSVEDRDFYQQNYQPYYRSADRWKGNTKGGKKGSKGKGYDELDRFDRLSPQERKRQWDAQRETIKAAVQSGNLSDLWYALSRGWHPCAGAFTKKLRDAKSKLKKIDLIVGAGGRERGSPRKGQKQRGRQQREQVPVSADEPPAFQAKWFVHAPSQQDSRQPLDIDEKSNAGFLGRQKECSDTDLAPDLREIQLKVKGTVPAGCLLKVHMNGRETELKPEIRSKRGEVLPAESHQETTFHVRRPEPEPETFVAVADLPSAAACPRGGLSFVPSVEFDACAMVARTDIKLLIPTIELVEVHDTAVVLSLRNLTGQRFELTVYASGAEAPGVASTLVQCGPVRGSESVHRISPLEASQVYVAWVKVFSDTKTAESKQKGFKTLEAKEKTIWDDKDHVILGVSEDATTKEIVKAWRSKSLQYHPDKVPDEQKEEAEEMMKRLNLAKQNMMKFAKVTPEQDAASPTAEAAQEDEEDDPSVDAEGGPSQSPPEFDHADSDKASSSAGAQKPYTGKLSVTLRRLKYKCHALTRGKGWCFRLLVAAVSKHRHTQTQHYALWSQTGASGDLRPVWGTLSVAQGTSVAINKTVRDLRLYQGRLQCYENLKAGIPPAEGETTPSMEELLTLEEQIKDLDKELFGIVEEDLQKIFFHVRQSEAIIEPALSGLQEQALQSGLLLEESQLQRLQEILPFTLENPAEVCQKLIDMRLVQDIGAMSAAILDLAYGYNQFLDSMDEHTQYLEINVAGFRKLLKRHEKQVPHKFHATRTPCLGFHRLVTHTSRQLVDIATMLGLTIGDAIERMDAALASMHTAAAKAVQRNREQFPELRAPKGLGPESQMVLQIQAQLKEPSVQAMIPNSGPVDFLYPKPSPPQARSGSFKGIL
eukprot:s717_g3.t3